ncbi:MAG: glucosyltransferase domain-containing protein [Acutalibacteraceae bacterium]|jgi:hypothetical protein
MKNVREKECFLREEWERFQQFLRSNWGFVLFAALLTVVCYAHNAFTGNIRVDSEIFINNPGTMQGWLKNERFGQPILKALLHNTYYNPYWSGILFLLLFFGGCVLWCYLFDTIAPGMKYKWVFALVYLTAQTWAYMFYFSMMSAEVALGIAMIPFALLILCRMAGKPLRRAWFGYLIAAGCFFLSMASYQANASLIVSGAAFCLLLWAGSLVEKSEAEETANLRFSLFLRRALVYVVPFLCAFVVYEIVAKLFFSAGDYLDALNWWRIFPVKTCLHNIAGKIKQSILGTSIAYSAAYGVALLLTAVYLIMLLFRRCSVQAKSCILLTAAVLCVSPFLLLFLLANISAPRTQFSLQFCAAALLFFCVNRLELKGFVRRLVRPTIVICALLIGVQQVTRMQRLFYTDDIRYNQDRDFAVELVQTIDSCCGERTEELPVVFVGKKDVPLNDACIESDVFGHSMFSWDYSAAEPARNNSRALGFIENAFGIEYKIATAEQRKQAEKIAKEMPCYPQDGSIREKDGLIVVKLSD